MMPRKKIVDGFPIYQNWPRPLVEKFDEAWKGHYSNRREATLDAVRKLIAQLKEA